MSIGKIKKQKKQKKAQGSGLFSSIKNLFSKNKEKKSKKKKAKENKKIEKAMAKKKNKTEKKQAKSANKAAKQKNKTDKKQAKATNKATKQAAKQQKQRNFDLENALTTASMVKDAVAQNVPGADKYLNVQQDNDEEYMDNEVNSSGEKNIASTNKDEGFISKHKGLLIGGGIVLLAALGAVLIAKSRKSTPTPTTTTPVSGVGYIEPIELS